LIKQYTKKGSLYYSDDHTAYAMLNMIGKHQVVAHERDEYVKEKIPILMELKDSGVIQRHGCIITGEYLNSIFM
jgi:hypothetical protein